MTARWKWIAAGIALLVLAGCGDDAEDSAGIRDPDSLGLEKIEIPENHPSPGALPRVRLRQHYPPGHYSLHATNHSVLRVDGMPKVLEKEKEYWYTVSVWRPNSLGQLRLVGRTKRAKYYRSNVGRRLDSDGNRGT